MLRITADNEQWPALLKLEGKLSGPWVNEVERVWRLLSEGETLNHLMVDLSGVTFVDRKGRKLLGRMSRRGAGFRASHCLTKYIVESVRQESVGSQKDEG